MHKYVSFGIGIALLASPLVASAQTPGTSAYDTAVASLTALVQQLTQQLQQLLAARSTITTQQTTVSYSSPQPAASGMTTDVALICNASTNLKRGDTDATTGGKVSKLQAMLGISPATGYYGALTAIGYGNICGGGNAQPASVSGMSKYTDSDFGFSFWYPNDWKVDPYAGEGSGVRGNLEDCTIQKFYTVHGDKPSNGVSISQYYCPKSSMTLRGANGANPVGMDIKYYFDTSTHAWMAADLSDPPNGSPRTVRSADTSNNTMGGLHIFAGVARFGADVVIPLSAKNFLIVSTNDYGGYIDERLFAKTIVATDPTVATPVSTQQQIATIQAEAKAYGVSAPNASSAFSASPTSGAAPLMVTFSNLPTSAAEEELNYGDGKSTSNGFNGSWPSGSLTHTYTTPGTYVANIVGLMSNGQLGSVTITVTGGNSTSLQTYTNSQYGFSLQYPSDLPVQTTGYGSLPTINKSPEAYFNLVDTKDNVEAYLLASVAPYNSSAAAAATGCNTTGTPTVINGVSFNKTSIPFGDFGNHTYATIKNGMCYELDIFMFKYSGVLAQSPMNTNAGDTFLTSKFLPIIQTFRFTQ